MAKPIVVNLYKVNKAIANAIKSSIVNEGDVETNPVHIYCNEMFEDSTKVYNNIAINKEKYEAPFIAVGELSEIFKADNVLGISIEIAIPQTEIKEILTDGVIEYENYERLSELAEIVYQTILDSTKFGASKICHDLKKVMYSPNEIQVGKNEYVGTLELTYALPLSI